MSSYYTKIVCSVSRDIPNTILFYWQSTLHETLCATYVPRYTLLCHVMKLTLNDDTIALITQRMCDLLIQHYCYTRFWTPFVKGVTQCLDIAVSHYLRIPYTQSFYHSQNFGVFGVFKSLVDRIAMASGLFHMKIDHHDKEVFSKIVCAFILLMSSDHDRFDIFVHDEYRSFNTDIAHEFERAHRDIVIKNDCHVLANGNKISYREERNTHGVII